MNTNKTKDTTERIIELPIKELHPFPDHPFRVMDDASMQETAESVKTYGVLVPITVRKREDGGYEIVSGHRRVHACELAGRETVPAIVRDMDRDTAVIVMVDSNLQRNEILPSERAAAYKMKMEAIKHQGKKLEYTSPQGAAKQRSDDTVAQTENISGDTVRRYIRLTELIPSIQQMVDEKKIGLTPAVELSYLKPEEQSILFETMDSEQTTPSLSQAQRLRKMSSEHELNEDSILKLMSEPKKAVSEEFVMPAARIRQFFPKSYTPERMQEVIFKLLEGWQRRREQNRER